MKSYRQHGCTDAMVVTNNQFTSAAQALAKDNGVILLPGVYKSCNMAAKLSTTTEKIVLWGVYIFFVMAVLVAAIEATIARPTLLNITGIVIIVMLVAAPLWIEGIKRLLKKLKRNKFVSVTEASVCNTNSAICEREKVKVSEALQPIQAEINVETAHSLPTEMSVKVDTAAVYQYLFRKMGDLSPSMDQMKKLCAAPTISTSRIQRECNMGYVRAAKILDELEKAGFITPFDQGTVRKWIGPYKK